MSQVDTWKHRIEEAIEVAIHNTREHVLEEMFAHNPKVINGALDTASAAALYTCYTKRRPRDEAVTGSPLKEEFPCLSLKREDIAKLLNIHSKDPRLTDKFCCAFAIEYGELVTCNSDDVDLESFLVDSAIELNQHIGAGGSSDDGTRSFDGAPAAQTAPRKHKVIAGNPNVAHYPKSDSHQFGEFAGPVFEMGGYSDITIVNPYNGNRLWVSQAFDGSADLYTAMERAIVVARKIDFFEQKE